MKDWDTRKALDAVLDAPKSLQREWEKHGATGLLTKFPIFMVTICLVASVFFAYHSGFVDGTSLKPGDEPSLNVNGDLDVYLPEGSPVLESIKEVVMDQVNAGIDIPTDGEVRRESYVLYQCRFLNGISFQEVTHKIKSKYLTQSKYAYLRKLQ